jgi:putative inorganic carbon (hco3(-)) transporter
MITDLLVLLCLAVFSVSNVIAPFSFALAYVWADSFYPQYIAYNMLGNAPISMILGVLMLAFYVLGDRKIMPKATALLTLYALLAIWISLTTLNAVLPGPAAVKYNASITVLLVAGFLPFVINTRIRIEAFLMVMLFGSAVHIMTWGFKTMISGGGYGKSLGLVGVNASALSEGSTMAAFVYFCIPMFFYLIQHNAILNLSSTWRRYLFWGLSVNFAAAAFGTFARTGLISLACLLAGYFIRSKRKLLFLPIIAAFGVGFVYASVDWQERMGTIADYKNEGSANTRVIVWQWAWDYAQQHPLGGGFEVYLTQDITTSQIGEDGLPIHVVKRAFHSIYFANLAEHGYPGILLFLAIIAATFLALRRCRVLTRERADLLWAYDLAGHLQIGLFALVSGYAFVDPAYYPILWYPLAMAPCLYSVVLRAAAEPAPRFADPPLQAVSALANPMV